MPALLFFLLFTGYPIVYSFILSLQQSEGNVTTFAGLDNYIRLFQDPIFYESLSNTLIILVLQVPIMLFFALILAVLMNSTMLKAKGFFRVAYFSPAVASLVSAAVIFLLLLNPDYGLINYLLSFIGIDKIGWLNHPVWAKISIVLVMIWRWTGYNMVILLAGMQNISNDLYEAARIDGAGKVRQFFSITIPQLKPVILFTAIVSTIGTLQLFDEPYNLTGGGPVNATTTITMYLYQNAFEYFDFEYASAIAYVVVVLIAVLSFIQFKLAGDDE
ncbi:sugar ABC transporter permease [Gracilibacillus salinarum]|uniref:Sugar ABC transporter permease n=1 Tax=Gracilibacillus salinarum TaxID=2932255 RepID=A0ABY4GTN6_9BACI|nr:sugar ABC transporter permease [Gracilibacillus salinarum]UOQ87495.1 sugar ABC transporter permease [Gracilibacillus salinarum]